MAAVKEYITRVPRFFDGVYYFEDEKISMDPKRAEAINKRQRKPVLVELAGQAEPRAAAKPKTEE